MIVLGFTVLWLVRVGQAAGSLVISGAPSYGLGPGTGLAFGGGLVLLLAAVVLRGRGSGRSPCTYPRRIQRYRHSTARRRTTAERVHRSEGRCG